MSLILVMVYSAPPLSIRNTAALEKFKSRGLLHYEFYHFSLKVQPCFVQQNRPVQKRPSKIALDRDRTLILSKNELIVKINYTIPNRVCDLSRLCVIPHSFTVGLVHKFSCFVFEFEEKLSDAQGSPLPLPLTHFFSSAKKEARIKKIS